MSLKITKKLTLTLTVSRLGGRYSDPPNNKCVQKMGASHWVRIGKKI